MILETLMTLYSLLIMVLFTLIAESFNLISAITVYLHVGWILAWELIREQLFS